MLYRRNLKLSILESAKYSPVILLIGARQTGKSTLIQGLYSKDQSLEYLSMDNLTFLDAARTAPQSFIQGLPERVIIDEIQRVPQIFLSIKESVDQNRKPGRFLLTGSADVLSLPKLSESLAGRMEIYNLWPLSQGEIRGKQESFVDNLFDSMPIQSKGIDLRVLLKAIVAGGYPDSIIRSSKRARSAWFKSYLTTIMERDIRDLANIEGISALPNLLSMIASRAGGLLNTADLSRSLELPYMTLKRYLSLLEAVFIVAPLQPWSNNRGKRLMKTAKVFLNDTGLLCHILGVDEKALESNRTILGHVLENFVVSELRKQISWSETQPRIYHFRTLSGQEVDVVLEAASGEIIGIECKASATVNMDSFKGLNVLKEQAGKQFRRGIILYTGTKVVSFASDLQAVPISTLWENSTKSTHST